MLAMEKQDVDPGACQIFLLPQDEFVIMMCPLYLISKIIQGINKL